MPELLTILAAAIAAGASLVAVTLSKEQKVSEFRQAWIDALREDLASFLSSARAFARAMDARRLHGSKTTDPAKTPFTLEKVGEIRLAAAETFYRIKLRLNPDEEKHKELLRLLSQAIAAQNAVLESDGADKRDVLAAVESAAEFAQPILKAEWNRVKRGEKAFRVARIGAVVIIVVSILAILIPYRQKKEPNKSPQSTTPSVTPPAGQEARQP